MTVTAIERPASSSNRRFVPLARPSSCSAVAYAVRGASLYDGMRDPQVFLNLFRASPFLLISADRR